MKLGGSGWRKEASHRYGAAQYFCHGLVFWNKHSLNSLFKSLKENRKGDLGKSSLKVQLKVKLVKITFFRFYKGV